LWDAAGKRSRKRPGIRKAGRIAELALKKCLEYPADRRSIPPGELPPIDKMTQRGCEDIEAVIKGPIARRLS
jgi:hypothetical protein